MTPEQIAAAAAILDAQPVPTEGRLVLPDLPRSRRWESMAHPTKEGRTIIRYHSVDRTACSHVEVDTEPFLCEDPRAVRALTAWVVMDLRRKCREFMRSRQPPALIPLASLFPGLLKRKTELERIGFLHRGKV